MNDIKEGVRAYLERESGIHAVCAPARHTGEYPLLTVDAREDGAVLCAGGAQAEHRYRVSIRCAGDRVTVSDKSGRVYHARASDSVRYPSHCVTVVEVTEVSVPASQGSAEGGTAHKEG